MKLNLSHLIVLLQYLQLGQTANTPCKKDACYQAVAIQNSNNPTLSKRKADCRAVLKKRVDDDIKTITSTLLKTTVVGTDTVTITTSVTTFIGAVGFNRRDALPTQAAGTQDNFDVLEERDSIVVEGKVPTYAKACKSLIDYGTACLCFGVDAADIRRLTISATSTTLTEVTTTTTAYATATVNGCSDATVCNAFFYGCASGCTCYRTDAGNRCVGAETGCGKFCLASSQCDAGDVCVFDSCCAPPLTGSCIQQSCAFLTAPSRLFKKDLSSQLRGNASFGGFTKRLDGAVKVAA